MLELNVNFKEENKGKLMKWKQNTFKVVEIVVKNVKWVWNKNNDEKKRWFPLI